MNTLLNLDHSIFLALNRIGNEWLDYLFGWPTFLGEGYVFLPIVFLFMLIWVEPKKIPQAFIAVLICFALASFANHFLKHAIHRARPWSFFYDAISQGKVAVHFLFAIDTAGSFPSGHTTVIFSLAYVLNRLHGKRMVFVYAIAAWVGFTRIYCGAHFPSDVLAGALVGTIASAIGFWIFDQVSRRIKFSCCGN